MSADHATIAEEEYLQIMFWLEEAGLPITGANIARAMQLSPPTVHEMIGRLERDGYVTRAADKSLTFTDSGREQAEAIVRRHRLIERFLTDVLGMPWDEVHEEAERLEHAMSPVLEERMLAAIGDARRARTATRSSRARASRASLLADVEAGATVHVLRFENEAEELLHYLKESGLHPGLDGELESSDDDEVVVASADGRHAVSRSVAETVSVRADPAPAPRAPLPEALVLSSDRYGRYGALSAVRPLAHLDVAADLPQPPVERLVLRPHRGSAPADVRLVLTHGGGERREAPFRQVALAHGIELPGSLDHPNRTHLATSSCFRFGLLWPPDRPNFGSPLVKITLAFS